MGRTGAQRAFSEDCAIGERTLYPTHDVRCKEDSRLWRTIDFVGENGLLHLQVEEPLSDLLDQFLCHILREELDTELEVQW